MTKRQHAAILCAVFLTTIAIAAISSSLQAQSRRVPETSSSTQTTSSPVSTIPAASTSSWDYRILSSPLSKAANTPRVQRRSVDSFPTPSLAGPTLEERIRELAEQGYEVQSFNVVPPACNGSSREFESEAEVIVLLRRMKK